MKLLFKIFDLPILGPKIKMMVASGTGGMQESQILIEYTNHKYKVDVGMYSYGGCFTPGFNLGGTVSIGRYCSFATDIHYFGANHPMEYVSTSPYFYNKAFGKAVKDIKREKLTIGNDVWVGYGVIITSNCHSIGNGAVLAAGSIVTKDVPPYAVVAGSPARVIKYRFSQEVQQAIENSKWWEKTPDQCMEYYDYIDKPEEFCRRIIDDGKKL